MEALLFARLRRVINVNTNLRGAGRELLFAIAAAVVVELIKLAIVLLLL